MHIMSSMNLEVFPLKLSHLQILSQVKNPIQYIILNGSNNCRQYQTLQVRDSIKG